VFALGFALDFPNLLAELRVFSAFSLFSLKRSPDKPFIILHCTKSLIEFDAAVPE
jgi:hypothetical protein